MDLQLSGKRAIVTGSTAGIGYSIAAALAAEGAAVTVNGRSQKRVDEAVSKLRAEQPGADILGVAADLSTAADADALTKVIANTDILVNNAGMYEPKPFVEISDDAWTRIFEVNVMSGIRLSRAYLPGMLKRNWGRIIFISSESGLQIPVEMIHYGVTKTAQLALARGLAEMTAGTNVTVNSVLPGPTRSEGVEQFVEDMARSKNTSAQEVERDFFQSVRPTSLLKRFETPEEIAAVVAFVCSPLASAINGSSLRAEGGVIRAFA